MHNTVRSSHFCGLQHTNLQALFQLGIKSNIIRLKGNSCIYFKYDIYSLNYTIKITGMWANAHRDGRPAEYWWRPLFNAAKFG